MAELQFEAPLVKFDGEEWNDFNDFQTATDLQNFSKHSDMPTEKVDDGLTDNFSETFSGSLEDLVNTFDENITTCFCNYDDKVENFAPVQVRTQGEIMNDCQCADPLLWRHNGRDSVLNHQPHHCLLNDLFRRRSKETSKLRITGLCAGNSPETGELPAQMASNAKNVSIWWRHHMTMYRS